MSKDRKTLAWIKDAVEEHLKDVFHAPDEYIENPDDVSPIQACIAPLRLIKGALDMVGVSGGVILTEEIITLAEEIIAGNVKNKRDAAEALIGGMLQLPGYLDSLYHGQPDIPLILLPQLNDLRAAQDKGLLSEGEFFSPDLSITAPVQQLNKCIVSGDMQTVAKKLRPGYLSGLLGIIQDQGNMTESVEKLILVVENLLLASKEEKSRQLWWITLGVVESLYEKGLEPSISLKKLLGRVDRQIQTIVESGEAELEKNPPDKVLKNLLYYIAQSRTYNTHVVELKKIFKLDYPEDDIVRRARENLFGFNSNLIESISEQVKEELKTIKAALEICIHARKGSTEGLDESLKSFDSVADAMGMLGIDSQKDYVLEQKQFLESIIADNKSLTEDDVMNIAAALLKIESSLHNLGSSVQTLYAEDAISPADYNESLKLVSKEILKEISNIKNSMQDFSIDANDKKYVQNVPAILSKLIGAMNVLRHDTQANLLTSANLFIESELLGSETTISDESLDRLADAIAGVENFYRTIIEESVAPELGLKVATESLTNLGYTPKIAALNANFSEVLPEFSLDSGGMH